MENVKLVKTFDKEKLKTIHFGVNGT